MTAATAALAAEVADLRAELAEVRQECAAMREGLIAALGAVEVPVPACLADPRDELAPVRARRRERAILAGGAR